MLHNVIAEILVSKEYIPAVLAVAVVLISVLYYKIKNRGLPPGPIGLPYIGYWPFLKHDNLHGQFMDLQKKYGDLFSFTITGHLYINLPTVKLIREAHLTNSDCFTDRIEDWNFLAFVFKDGVAFSNGEHWKVNRKFFLGHLKQNMLSTKEISESMYDSVKSTIEELKTLQGDPVKIVDVVCSKCNEILRRVMFGNSDVTVDQLKEINDSYAVVLHSMSAQTLLLVGEFARSMIFTRLPAYKDVMTHHKIVEDLIYKIIEDHKTTYREDNIRDMIDSYIKEQKERTEKGDVNAKYFTDRALMASLYQFIGDGILSVAAFIGVYLTFAAEHPEEQEKIFDEIVDVVGLERLPTMEDKNKMPYTNGFIYELLRRSEFFPFFPSQQCRKETTIAGYRIPKGAITLMNTYSAHHDPLVYDDPEKFDPFRYVPKEGKPRAELPVSFGIGKRACMGEGYAMSQIFLFFASIIQNFNLTLPSESQKMTIEKIASGDMLICAQLRSQK